MHNSGLQQNANLQVSVLVIVLVLYAKIYIDKYENLRHLLMDCKEPQILDARWKFIYDACQAVQLYAADISFVQQIRKFTILFSTGSVRFQMDNATIEDYVILKRGTVE